MPRSAACIAIRAQLVPQGAKPAIRLVQIARNGNSRVPAPQPAIPITLILFAMTPPSRALKWYSGQNVTVQSDYGRSVQ